MNPILFEGEPGFLGGLSNEAELAKQCPDSFKGRNAWSDYASDIFFKGANIKNWKFKDPDKKVQQKQMSCFKGLLSSFDIAHEDKEAVAGWMLSEMLIEVPEYQSPKEIKK